MKITTIGIDLAKNVFQVHGVDAHGRTVLKKQLKRDQVANFFIQLEPCLIGMEACGGAHHWGRKLQAMGHTVRLMAPQFVKPYVKTNKNDVADTEAICEAVVRPNMRFVAIKTVDQQSALALHRHVKGLSGRAPRKPIRFGDCWPNLAWSCLKESTTWPSGYLNSCKTRRIN